MNSYNAAPGRARLFAQSSLAVIGAGMLAALVLLPTVALADNECGVGADVTCKVSGNPYPNGVTYIVPGTNETLHFQNGVVVDSSAGFNAGILIIQPGAETITIDAPTNVSVTAGSGGGYGLLLATTSGDITVNLDKINNAQAGVTGALLSSSTGKLSYTGNSITTTGTGVDAGTNDADITVKVGTVATTGAGGVGVSALSQGSGSGNLSVTTTTVSTKGANAAGINATTSSGKATVTSGSVSTTGAGSAGIIANSGNLATVNSTSVATTGANAAGISVNSNKSGGATVTSGTVSATGAGSVGIQVFGNKNLSVTSGAVTANSTGIVVSTLPFFGFPPLVGPGTATVTTTGNVTSSTADAIDVFTQAGAISVTTATGTALNANGSGIRAVSNGVGDGGVDGLSDGNVSVVNGASIGASKAVGGLGIDAQVTNVASKGAVLVTNTGAITATGPGVQAINVGAGGATVSSSGAIISSGSDGVVLNAAGGKASLTNSGSITGAVNGASLTSSTSSSITNSGTLDGTSYAFRVFGGPATVTNSGTINQRFSLTAGADTLTNSGTVNVGQSSDFGAGADTFANAGTVRVLPASAVAGSVTFTGLETFNNTGLIDFRNGHAGDVLTLPGAYTGAGSAALALDASLGAPAATADRLVVGGAATGSTAVVLNQVGAGPALLNPGVLVVQGGAGSSATAFQVAPSSVLNGFVQYGIVFNPATFAYTLTGAPNVSAYRPLLFADNLRSAWEESADVWTSHMRETRDYAAAGGSAQTGVHFWGQFYGDRLKRDDVRTISNFGQTSNFDLGYHQRLFGEELGVDWTQANEGGSYTIGGMGGFQSSRTRFGGTNDMLSYDVANGGVYGSFNAGPFFLNGLAKADYYWGHNSSVSAAYEQDIDGWIYGARVEGGLRFNAGGGFYAEPVASLSYVHASLDDFQAQGATISFDEDAGLRGKLGGRVGMAFNGEGMRTSAYLGANYVHEFMGEDNLLFSSGTQALAFSNPHVGDYGEGLIGVNMDSATGFSLFTEGRYSQGNGLRGFGGRIGMRMRY